MSQRAAAAPILTRFFRRRGLWRLGMLLVILLIMAGYVSPLKSLYTRNQQISQEQAATEELRYQRDALQREKERLQDNSYVEQIARRDLGLIRPGEQPYVVKEINQETSESVAAPTSATPEKESFVGKVLDGLKSLLP